MFNPGREDHLWLVDHGPDDTADFGHVRALGLSLPGAFDEFCIPERAAADAIRLG